MSDPTMINENDPSDDKDLSALYERASTEQPSKELDNAILAQAQQEIQPTSRASDYFPAWTQSLSVAAVMALSVTVLFMIEEESPEVTEMLEGSAPVVQMEQEEPDKLDMLAKTPARLKERRQANKDVGANVASTPLAPREKISVMSDAIPAKAKARKKQQVPAMEADTEIARFSKPTQAPAAMGIMADQMDEDAKEVISCQQLSEKACLESAACTLSKNKRTQAYQCLPAKDHCELMFRQKDGNKETCETKKGCEFIPSSCNCPPDTTCVCGEGEPRQCKSKNHK